MADGKSSQVRDPHVLRGDGLGTAAAVDFPPLLHDVLLQVLDVASQARVLNAPIPTYIVWPYCLNGALRFLFFNVNSEEIIYTCFYQKILT